MIKNKNLGIVNGNPYVFSEADIAHMAESLDMDIDEFLEEYNGIACKMNLSDTDNIGVDVFQWVDKNSTAYPVVVIGGNPNDFQKFLEE